MRRGVGNAFQSVGLGAAIPHFPPDSDEEGIFWEGEIDFCELLTDHCVGYIASDAREWRNWQTRWI